MESAQAAPRPRTLVELIEQRATSKDTWLLFPSDPFRSDAAVSYSYADVCERARAIAAGLRARDPSTQSPVGMIFDNDVDFCVAFLGIVLAAKIPVPLHPPYFASDPDAYRERIAFVLDECDAELLLVADAIRPVLGAFGQSPRPVRSLAELLQRDLALRTPATVPDDIAYIQFSSGSTRAPLGAELSHSAVISNLHGIGCAIGAAPGHCGLCWLPLFHDMGLAGTLLCSFYCGASLVLMTPRDFVVRPASWLWAMSRFRCRTSAAPNFAYALCTSRTKVPDRILDGLALDGWDVALTGAESVRSETIDAFVGRFSPYGFRKSAMMPVYGLAENVVASCFPALGSEPRVDTVDREALEQTQFASPSRPERGRSRRVTSVGRPLVGQRLRIVDGADAPVAERVVGAVQISGACVMKGYRKRPMESVSVFTKDGWLRTGDLGYLAGGDLFIVGREKDIIKKNGAKYDAADIQGVVSAVHGARAGGAAVFSVDDPECGTEAIVAVVETRLSRTDDLDALKAAVAREVRQVFGTSLDRVVLVPVGSLAKSTSGKVRNAACRDAFLRGTVRELQVLGASE